LLPGPGTYEKPTIIEEMVKKPWGKNGVFGSTERRFVPSHGNPTAQPGPGAYIHQGVIGDTPTAASDIKRTSSMFTSKTKRMQYMNEAGPTQAAHVVQYDNQQNTIAANVRKKVEALNNPLLANLHGKNSTTLAFLSNAPRFGNKNSDESEAFLGPGYYEQKSQFTEQERAKTQITQGQKNQILINGAPALKQSDPRNLNFMAQAPRFGPEQSSKKVINPGPGHYSVENASGWFKRSYNMNFSEM